MKKPLLVLSLRRWLGVAKGFLAGSSVDDDELVKSELGRLLVDTADAGGAASEASELCVLLDSLAGAVAGSKGEADTAREVWLG